MREFIKVGNLHINPAQVAFLKAEVQPGVINLMIGSAFVLSGPGCFVVDLDTDGTAELLLACLGPDGAKRFLADVRVAVDG